MKIDYTSIRRNPVVRISGAIMFMLTVYTVYNGTATITEASPLFLLCLWIASGSPTTKAKRKGNEASEQADEHNCKCD